MIRATLIGMLLAPACRKPVVAPSPNPVDAGPEALGGGREDPAGRVQAGCFEDARHPMSVKVPSGWRARPGAADSPQRVRLHNPATGAWIEIISLGEGAPLAPLDREGCTWVFIDSGPYDTLRTGGDSTVATCRPGVAGQARVISTLVTVEGHSWEVDLGLPGERLVRSLRAAESVLDTLRWGPGC